MIFFIFSAEIKKIQISRHYLQASKRHEKNKKNALFPSFAYVTNETAHFKNEFSPVNENCVKWNLTNFYSLV